MEETNVFAVIRTMESEVAQMRTKCDSDAELRDRLLKAASDCRAKVVELTKAAQRVERQLLSLTPIGRRPAHLLLLLQLKLLLLLRRRC